MTTDQRSSALPDVPTVKETFPDFPEIRSWQGVVGPKGLQAEVVDLIGREVLAVTAQPDFKRRLAPLGFEILPLNAQQLAAYMVSEYAKWERLAKQAGIEPQ
jgi:tripartite-type tricarboxylate transporter receptor subunit TctC